MVVRGSACEACAAAGDADLAHQRDELRAVAVLEVGRLVGLGQDVAITSLQPAWPLQPQDRTAPVVLPVYYHWVFATGSGGDFESLVRTLWENIPVHLGSGFGTRPVDASAPGSGLSWPGAVVALEGAGVSRGPLVVTESGQA